MDRIDGFIGVKLTSIISRRRTVTSRGKTYEGKKIPEDGSLQVAK